MRPLRRLDAIVRERHLLKHPFYTAWSRGEVPLPTLRAYAEQYYHFESRFPQFVAGAYSRLPRPEDRRLLLDNLLDEEGRAVTHPELWWRFARSVGAPANPGRAAPPLPVTTALLREYERWTLRGTPGSALGALFAYESQFPEVAREKSRGLREQYGIDGDGAHEFFRVHAYADLEHGRAERRLLQRLLRGSPKAEAEATRAARRSLDAWWRFLDAFVPAPRAGG